MRLHVMYAERNRKVVKIRKTTGFFILRSLSKSVSRTTKTTYNFFFIIYWQLLIEWGADTLAQNFKCETALSLMRHEEMRASLEGDSISKLLKKFPLWLIFTVLLTSYGCLFLHS